MRVRPHLLSLFFATIFLIALGLQSIAGLAVANGLSVPQLCIGVLLRTPGYTAAIVGAP